MTIKKYEDSRISRDLCIMQFNEIANEYLLREFGREVDGVCRMTWTEFETQSYAKDRTEVQINVVINYDKKTITLSHK